VPGRGGRDRLRASSPRFVRLHIPRRTAVRGSKAPAVNPSHRAATRQRCVNENTRTTFARICRMRGRDGRLAARAPWSRGPWSFAVRGGFGIAATKPVRQASRRAREERPRFALRTRCRRTAASRRARCSTRGQSRRGRGREASAPRASSGSPVRRRP